MSEEYCRGVLRVCLAQICQNLGWHAAQSTPLELLTDVLERYVVQLGKVTHRYAEQFGRTQPNLDDVALAFRHMDISLSELEEYVHHVEPLPFAHEVVAFPAQKQSSLRFPKPDSKELQTREDHIPDYLPLMYPTAEEEAESTEQDAGEDTTTSVATTSENQPTSVDGQAIIDVVTPVPGDKRILTSPLDNTPVRKRARLLTASLPQEAAHSEYKMKVIVITHTGDLTPTKGGKLPDARTPPSGFAKTLYDKEHFVMKKKKHDDKAPVLSIPQIKAEREVASPQRNEETKTTEEIIVYPGGNSKKLSKSKSHGDEEWKPMKEPYIKKPVIFSSSHKSSKLWTPNASKPKKKAGRPVGRPRSGSKSPRGRSKSPSQAKSPAQASGSPRGRGRPPKDKSQQKTPEKKPAIMRAPCTALEEMFSEEGVLDLSVGTKKKAEEPPVVPVPTMKQEEAEDASKPLDLSTGKESAMGTPKSESNDVKSPSPVAPPRPRGRPPISPEKKRARELSIAASIDAVVDRNREELKREELEKKETESAKAQEPTDNTMEETDKTERQVGSTDVQNVKTENVEEERSVPERMNVAQEAEATVPSLVKEEPVTQPMEWETSAAETKKKKKKNKDKNEDQVREKLKEKLKHKDGENKEIKRELISNQEEETVPAMSESSRQASDKPSGMFDFSTSPVRTKPMEDIKVEPLKLFTVEIPDAGRDGDHGREKSKDREKSKEHKKEKKEKKRDKEKKKKKDKDKDRDREKKKDKSKDYPSEYPTVSKLKIKLGSTPSATTVNVMSEPKASPIHEVVSPRNSPRPELKLVIKALPSLASQDKDSPSSTPKHTHKDKEKSKKEKTEKKERKEREQREKEQKEMEIKEAEVQRLQEIREKERKEQEERERIQREKEMKEREFQEKLKQEIVMSQQKERDKWQEPKKETPPPYPKEAPDGPPVLTSQPSSRTSVNVAQPSPSKSPSPDRQEARMRFTPSPSPSSQSTRKTFTPSPSPGSPTGSPSPTPDRSLRDSQSQSPERSISRSQSPVHTPSPSRTPSPVPSPIPSPPPSRPSVSPTPMKPPTPSASPEHSPTPSPRPSVARDDAAIPPMPPPSIGAAATVKPSVQRTVIAETVTTFIDESGAKVWICPSCKMPDDGSPMIGCDICDDWYHWPCVNIKESPPEDEPWYCVRCMPKQKTAKRGRGRGRGRGPGRGPGRGRKKSLL